MVQWTVAEDHPAVSTPLPPCLLINKDDHRARGGECAQCAKHHNKRARTKLCTRCKKLYCPACARWAPKCHALLTMTPVTNKPIADADSDGQQEIASPGNLPQTRPSDLPNLGVLLQIATGRPALPTLTWCPRNIRHRIGDLLLQRLSAATAALEAGEGEERAHTLQLLWLAPTLLLRRPPDQEGVPRPKGGRESGKLHWPARSGSAPPWLRPEAGPSWSRITWRSRQCTRRRP